MFPFQLRIRKSALDKKGLFLQWSQFQKHGHSQQHSQRNADRDKQQVDQFCLRFGILVQIIEKVFLEE